MSKALLILDMPKTCLDCIFCFELDEGINACCSVMFDEKDSSLCREINCKDGYCQNKPDWCPLKEIPEKKNIDCCYDLYKRGRKIGWNECLEAILSE